MLLLFFGWLNECYLFLDWIRRTTISLLFGLFSFFLSLFLALLFFLFFIVVFAFFGDFLLLLLFFFWFG